LPGRLDACQDRAVPARIAVVVPTRNERGNVEELARSLFALGLDLELWVMDDASTDGTPEALEAMAAGEPRIHVVRRSGERGYGRASAEGLRRSLDAGAELVLQMDGDLSHDPRYVPDLVRAAEGADLVIGSRYLHGVSVVNWSLKRLILSTWANAYVRALAGLTPRDCTSGFRLWRAALLGRLGLERVRSEGYSFLVECLFRASRDRARIAEVPIVFVERKAGESKLSTGVMIESAILPWRLLGRRLLERLR
jgi:dolichol-phosphate mannosyltransferase